MDFKALESELVAALPERVETSDYNWSGVGIGQGNLGIQLGALSGQALFQVNAAGVTVSQTNF